MARKAKKISTVEELERIIERSSKKPVFIFKHDVAMQESEDAYEEYLKFMEESEEDILFTTIYVREDAEVSKSVEEMLDVNHEVPQLILVMDEEAVWDDSKKNITQENLIEVVEEYISM